MRAVVGSVVRSRQAPTLSGSCYAYGPNCTLLAVLKYCYLDFEAKLELLFDFEQDSHEDLGVLLLNG